MIARSDVPGGIVFRLRTRVLLNSPGGGAFFGGAFFTGRLFAVGFFVGGFLGGGITSSFQVLPNGGELRLLQPPEVVATFARRHSARATTLTAMQSKNSPATIAHSTEPLWWSGSKPVSASIQSRHHKVSTASTPHKDAREVSSQKRARTFDFIVGLTFKVGTARSADAPR